MGVEVFRWMEDNVQNEELNIEYPSGMVRKHEEYVNDVATKIEELDGLEGVRDQFAYAASEILDPQRKYFFDAFEDVRDGRWEAAERNLNRAKRLTKLLGDLYEDVTEEENHEYVESSSKVLDKLGDLMPENDSEQAESTSSSRATAI